MSDKGFELQNPQTVANVIHKMSEMKFKDGASNSTADLATNIIRERVNKDYNKRVGGTAKLELSSQAYYILDEKIPELTKAMRDEVDQKAELANYFWSEYVQMPEEISGRYMKHEKREEIAKTQPQEIQDKAWAAAIQKADAVVDVIHGVTKNRFPDSNKDDITYSIRLQEVIKNEMEERRDLITNEDESIIPILSKAVRAHRDTERIWQIRTNEIFRLVVKNADVKKASEKQKRHRDAKSVDATK